MLARWVRFCARNRWFVVLVWMVVLHLDRAQYPGAGQHRAPGPVRLLARGQWRRNDANG